MSANIKKKKITAHFCLLNLVMINEHFERIVKEKFGFDFSPTQQEAMKNFLAFLFDRHPVTYCKREVWIRFFAHATGGNEEFFSFSL